MCHSIGLYWHIPVCISSSTSNHDILLFSRVRRHHTIVLDSALEACPRRNFKKQGLKNRLPQAWSSWRGCAQSAAKTGLAAAAAVTSTLSTTGCVGPHVAPPGHRSSYTSRILSPQNRNTVFHWVDAALQQVRDQRIPPPRAAYIYALPMACGFLAANGIVRAYDEPFGIGSGPRGADPEVAYGVAFAAAAAFADEFDTIRRLGGADSTLRTEEQSEIALFWEDGPWGVTAPGHFICIAVQLLQERGLDFIELARAFALIGMTQCDASSTAACTGRSITPRQRSPDAPSPGRPSAPPSR